MGEERTGSRLAGKVALISGGARGMGASHARAMVAEGGRVVLGDLLDDEGAAVARVGRLNVLVNNAGIVNWGPIGTYTGDQWDQIIAINLTGVFNGIDAAV